MKKKIKPKHFINKPIYEGGIKAMRKFLAEKQKYPKVALEEKIEGTVHIRYTVNNLGKVIRTQVIGGIGFGCDEEAERIVRLLKFKVAKTRKLRAEFHKTIRIHFRLPKQKKVQRKFQYVTPKKEGVQKKPASKNYSYTITWTAK